MSKQQESRHPYLEKIRIALFRSPFVTAVVFIFISWMSLAAIVMYCEQNVKDHNINNFEDAVWWGIVTLSTVGYGDKYPLSSSGRLFAVLLIFCGVGGIAIVTAKISSYFLERALRERRGFVDPSTLKNHFVICGWKDEMSNFLLHVLASNRGMKSSDIVLINNASDSDTENLLNIPELKDLKISKGEFYLEVNLKRVAPERAAKVLILADATPNAAGQIPTISEADARTVMTAMTLNNIAKGVLVAAEILDSAMEQYLRLAHVNEIIYSRDYSRLILAKASMGTGVTNIIHELLDPKSPSSLTTKPIPEELFNQTYEKLQSYFQGLSPHIVLVGILENSGNSFAAKEKALRRAQLTPNIAELVQNLQSVKALKFNQPVFGPKLDYTLREGAMAIVIETHLGESNA